MATKYEQPETISCGCNDGWLNIGVGVHGQWGQCPTCGHRMVFSRFHGTYPPPRFIGEEHYW